jgi:hypothetical protein
MPPVGFETTISAGERPQTYALDRAANGTGLICDLLADKYWQTITAPRASRENWYKQDSLQSSTLGRHAWSTEIVESLGPGPVIAIP